MSSKPSDWLHVIPCMLFLLWPKVQEDLSVHANPSELHHTNNELQAPQESELLSCQFRTRDISGKWPGNVDVKNQHPSGRCLATERDVLFGCRNYLPWWNSKNHVLCDGRERLSSRYHVHSKDRRNTGTTSDLHKLRNRRSWLQLGSRGYGGDYLWWNWTMASQQQMPKSSRDSYQRPIS